MKYGNSYLQRGWSMIEMMAVFIVIGVIVSLALRSVLGGNAAMRVNSAVNMVQQLQGAVNSATPRSGIYTGININDLIADGDFTPPNDSNGDPLDASEMNPWGGGVALDSAVATQFSIQFSGITEPDEAEQLARKLRQIGDVTTDETTVEVVIGS